MSSVVDRLDVLLEVDALANELVQSQWHSVSNDRQLVSVVLAKMVIQYHVHGCLYCWFSNIAQSALCRHRLLCCVAACQDLLQQKKSFGDVVVVHDSSKGGM